jgi:hypothetical protein
MMAAAIDREEADDGAGDYAMLNCWQAPPWRVGGDASGSSPSSPRARRVGYASPLPTPRRDGSDQTVRLSFPAPDPESAPGPGGWDDATYHLWLELELLSPPRSGWLPTLWLRAEVSLLVLDDADHSLVRGHAALARAGAIPHFSWDTYSSSPWTGPPPRGLLGDLILASCRLLRRHLELVAAPASSAGPSPRIQGSAAAAGAPLGAPYAIAGSEILSVFERIGVDVTEPALRAAEELLVVYRKRHANHWAQRQAVEDEKKRRRKRKSRQAAEREVVD